MNENVDKLTLFYRLTDTLKNLVAPVKKWKFVV